MFPKLRFDRVVLVTVTIYMKTTLISLKNFVRNRATGTEFFQISTLNHFRPEVSATTDWLEVSTNLITVDTQKLPLKPFVC